MPNATSDKTGTASAILRASMLEFYNRILRPLILGTLRLLSPFKPKISRGLAGRKALTREVEDFYRGERESRTRILIHVSSFGELEQAKPVIEQLRLSYPESIIHLTFFSPSGYENAVGKYLTPDLITYSPFDHRTDVENFLTLVRPSLVLYTKYDVWPNLSRELAKRGVPQILFSAVVPSAATTTKLGRKFFLAVYASLSKILTISEAEHKRFAELGIAAAHLLTGGDTRFDQVLARAASPAPAPLPERILQRCKENNTFVFVAGSLWPGDLTIIKPFLRASLKRADNVLFIIVPHEVTEKSIRKIESALPNTIRFSKLDEYQRESVIIVDTIGTLFALYQYADLAYVGGGFDSGVHNVLEPAVWSVPVAMGPRSGKSPEIAALVATGGGFEVTNPREFEFVSWRMMNDNALRRDAGEKASRFVVDNAGATERVLNVAKGLLER